MIAALLKIWPVVLMFVGWLLGIAGERSEQNKRRCECCGRRHTDGVPQ